MKREMINKVAETAHERKVVVDFMGWLQEQHMGDCVEDVNPERAADEFLGIDRDELDAERIALLDALDDYSSNTGRHLRPETKEGE